MNLENLLLTNECRELILNEVRASSKREIVFLLVGARSKRGVGTTIELLTNLSRSPDAFIISQLESTQLEKEIMENGMDILAFGHSHPSGSVEPSLADLQSFQFAKYPWIIVGEKNGILNFNVLYLKGNAIDWAD